MINSEGDKIRMEVHDLIPYVYLGAKDYRPTPDHEAELVMKVLGLIGNNHASRTIYLDGESGDEMSESDDGVGTYVDGPTKSPRKTKKKKRSRRKTVPAAAGEELDDDDGYEPSIREEDPEGDDVHVDEIPGADEDNEDDDDRVYQQLMIFRVMINQMKMKLALSMDHQKKKMMRMISMSMILMEEYGYQREVP